MNNIPFFILAHWLSKYVYENIINIIFPRKTKRDYILQRVMDLLYDNQTILYIAWWYLVQITYWHILFVKAKLNISISIFSVYISIILGYMSDVHETALYFQVAWIHIDRQMILTIHRHVISRIPRYSITYDNANTWLLHVSQAQQDDRGYYMCQVNTNPMISQVGYLQVVGRVWLNYDK